MAIGDNKKKSKNKQRVAGGSKNTNTNVNNAGNTGVVKPQQTVFNRTNTSKQGFSANTKGSRRVGQPSQKAPQGIIDSAKTTINNSFLGDIQRSGESDIQRAGIDAEKLTREQGFLGAPVVAAKQFLQLGATDAIERGANLVNTAATKVGQANRFLFGQGSEDVNTPAKQSRVPNITDIASDATAPAGQIPISQDITTSTARPRINISESGGQFEQGSVPFRQAGQGGRVEFKGNDDKGFGFADAGNATDNARLADSLRQGTKRVSTVDLNADADGRRLRNARAAVASLKASGASAAAQSEAFKRITQKGTGRREALQRGFDQAAAAGDQAGQGFFSKQINNIDKVAETARSGIAGRQASVDKTDVASDLATRRLGNTINTGDSNIIKSALKIDPNTQQVNSRSAIAQLTNRFGAGNLPSGLIFDALPKLTDFIRGQDGKVTFEEASNFVNRDPDIPLSQRQGIIADLKREYNV